MKIIRPNWVKHENKDKKGIPLSIFSIDVHPDGTRFATGGHGNDCGCVAIWNLAAVISPEVENDENQPKLLCQIDSHLQCVNCVRWSHSGNYLASAGDDKLIMIWQLGGRYQGQTEQYRIVATLRSHSGDILDLSWSHDDQYLASSSVDNMIVIWNTQRWPEVTKILQGHCGMVKGITWDPIGKYLASQSEDKTLRVWRISDWSEEVVIKEPFEQCGGTTHVLRPSWSPDGQHLVSAQAMNNNGSVAKIINRHDWSFPKDFVGHRKAIPCVRFNPNIFKYSKYSNNRKQKKSEQNNNENNVENDSNSIKYKPQTICALGSRDRSISIWSTVSPRPLVVIDDVFENSVVDLSWTKRGYHLLACSVDGSIVCFEFLEKEFGQIYNTEERMQYLQQLYGNSLFSQKNSIGNRLIEDMDILMIQNRKAVASSSTENQNGLTNCYKSTADTNCNNINVIDKQSSSLQSINHQNSNQTIKISPNKQEKSQQSVAATNTSPGRLAKGPTDKQIEIRSADGRRRIIPLFIPPTNSSPAIDATDTTCTNSSTAQTQQQNSNQKSSMTVPNPLTFSSSSESKSKIVIETLDESNPDQNLQAYQYLNNSSSLPPISAASINHSQQKPIVTSSMNNRISTSVKCNEIEIKSKPISTTDELSIVGEKNAMVTNKNKTTNSTNNGQAQQRKSMSPESDESSDDEIVIKRTKKIKFPSDQQQQSTKRKTGRPTSTSQQDKDLPAPQTTTTTPAASLSSVPANENLQKQQLEQLSKANKSSNQQNLVTSLGSTNNQVLPPQPKPPTISQPKIITSSTINSISFPSLRLPRQNHSNVRLFTKSEDGRVISGSIEYPLSSSGICKLIIFSDDQSLWNVMISNPIMALAANEEILACFCDDNSIQVFSTMNGRRLFVPIILESPVAKMVCANRSHFLLITCNAKIWLWDFLIPKVLIRGESLTPILIDPKTSEQLSIQNASVSVTSKPIVTISNGRTYIFETELNSWCLLNDLRDPLNSCTDLKPCAINKIKQLSTFSKIPSRSLLKFFSANASLAQQSEVSFIEKQIEVAKLLGAADEYRFWVLNLVQHLVSMHSFGGIHSDNIENRLKELCNNLLGSRFPSSYATTRLLSKKYDENGLTKNVNLESRMSVLRLKTTPFSNQNEFNSIMGLNKHDLLRDVLSILTSNLSLQRLYLEFKELLNSFNDQQQTISNAAINKNNKTDKNDNTNISGKNMEIDCNGNDKSEEKMIETTETIATNEINIINNGNNEK